MCVIFSWTGFLIVKDNAKQSKEKFKCNFSIFVVDIFQEHDTTLPMPNRNALILL